MHVVELKSQQPDIVFRLWCTRHARGWRVDAVQIWRRGEALLPKRSLNGSFDEVDAAVAHGVRWCELIIDFLLRGEHPPVPDCA